VKPPLLGFNANRLPDLNQAKTCDFATKRRRFAPCVAANSGHAALVGEASTTSPGLFKAMSQALPGMRVVEMIGGLGTCDLNRCIQKWSGASVRRAPR
jgi:hypothetical protein